MTDQSAPKASLTARLDMRFAAPLRQAAFARRTWFSVTVAAVVCLHVALLAAFLWRDREDTPRLASAEETPVEVIVEPPKAAPPKAKSPQPPAAKTPIEKPATSAPRAANDETSDHQDKDTHAPKSEAPKTAAAPPPPAEDAKADDAKAEAAKPDPAKPDPKTDDAKADAPKPPDVLQKDAEALDAVPPEPPKKPAAFAKPPPPVKTRLAKAHPAKTHFEKTALQKLAGSSDLPDYTFAKPMRKHAKVTGGTEDDRYLAVVFGLITQNRRDILVPGGQWYVAVAFQVDGSGNLVGLELQHSSGYRPVDAAAIEAVQRAAPFPPPPSGATTGLVARLHSVDDPRAAMMSDN